MTINKQSIFSKILQDQSTLLGCLFILIILLLALFAPLIAPNDPYEQNMAGRLVAPNSKNLLGTDEFGRMSYPESYMAAGFHFLSGSLPFLSAAWLAAF